MINRDLDDERRLLELSRQQRAFMGGVLVALAAGVALGFSAPLPVKTYDLVVVDAAGDAWVVEYGMTAEDCRRELPMWAMPATCE